MFLTLSLVVRLIIRPSAASNQEILEHQQRCLHMLHRLASAGWTPVERNAVAARFFSVLTDPHSSSHKNAVKGTRSTSLAPAFFLYRCSVGIYLDRKQQVIIGARHPPVIATHHSISPALGLYADRYKS